MNIRDNGPAAFEVLLDVRRMIPRLYRRSCVEKLQPAKAAWAVAGTLQYLQK